MPPQSAKLFQFNNFHQCDSCRRKVSWQDEPRRMHDLRALIDNKTSSPDRNTSSPTSRVTTKRSNNERQRHVQRWRHFWSAAGHLLVCHRVHELVARIINWRRSHGVTWPKFLTTTYWRWGLVPETKHRTQSRAKWTSTWTSLSPKRIKFAVELTWLKSLRLHVKRLLEWNFVNFLFLASVFRNSLSIDCFPNCYYSDTFNNRMNQHFMHYVLTLVSVPCSAAFDWLPGFRRHCCPKKHLKLFFAYSFYPLF